MSNRPDHIYELLKIGYTDQKQYAIDLLTQIDIPIYAISGNHDRYFIKSCGADICSDIGKEIKNFSFIGHDEGDIKIKDIKIKLWHGEDGNSYAISYRLQKIVEAFTGGEKPSILLAGHTHKYGKFFIRHIHTLGTGAISKQSKWMRSKRLENHTGFGIIKFKMNKMGISQLTDTFYPFYQ